MVTSVGGFLSALSPETGMLKGKERKKRLYFSHKVWSWWGVGEGEPCQSPESPLPPLEGNGAT